MLSGAAHRYWGGSGAAAERLVLPTFHHSCAAPSGEVTVALTRTGSRCHLAVSNPGPEISKEDLKNIFKRFYRSDTAHTQRGSYGLGLSIAQNIVLRHHGKIWAESKNGRNTFFVELPVK